MLVIGALLAAGAGCQRTPQEAHNDGVEAQKEADHKIAEARQQASDKIAEANHDVSAATDDARKKAAEAQAEANEKIRAANRDVVGTHDDVRDWAQKKIDDVDNMIDQASTKAQTAAPKAKAHFNNAIEEVKHQRDALQTEVASLEGDQGDKLDKSKEQFSERVDRIKDNIRNIEKSL
jgi:colicin import membrane protein